MQLPLGTDVNDILDEQLFKSAMLLWINDMPSAVVAKCKPGPSLCDRYKRQETQSSLFRGYRQSGDLCRD